MILLFMLNIFVTNEVLHLLTESEMQGGCWVDAGMTDPRLECQVGLRQQRHVDKG